MTDIGKNMLCRLSISVIIQDFFYMVRLILLVDQEQKHGVEIVAYPVVFIVLRGQALAQQRLL